MDAYKNVGKEAVIDLEEYPDNPKIFGGSLKLLTDAKQLIICHSGFRFDSYSGYCSHQCSYCYARGQNARYGRDGLLDIKIADIGEVAGVFEKAFAGKSSNIVAKCIQHRYHLRLGTQIDCFQACEAKYRITYRFINEIMNKYDYPYLVCTKNKMVADDYYMGLYHDNAAFQFTLSTLDQEYLNKIERGASTAKERLAAMKKLHDAGFTVICRISPYIPEYMNDIEDLVDALAENGCSHVISELLRVSPILNKIMIAECGYDVISLYKSKGVKMNAGYFRYPLEDKIKFQKHLAELCTKAGMTFATCADEDPSFHTTCNCCGIEKLCKFQNCPTATYDTAYKICKEKGEIAFEDLIANNWTPDVETLREGWNKGYWENVLMNFEFVPERKTYKFVEYNDRLARSMSQNVKKGNEELF